MRVAHNKLDLSGMKFGRLTALREEGRNKHGWVLWRFSCDCGNETVAVGFQVKRGTTTSCGCRQREARTTHGKHDTDTFKIYQYMKQRCTNPKHSAYARYGGRGITVCDRWLESFENFNADMGDRPSRQHTLDRIENDGPYSPGNCRWVTWDVQYRNRRQTVSITYDGETKCRKDWCQEYGVDESTFAQRLSRGWDVGTALKAPPYYQFFRDGPIP